MCNSWKCGIPDEISRRLPGGVLVEFLEESKAKWEISGGVPGGISGRVPSGILRETPGKITK